MSNNKRQIRFRTKNFMTGFNFNALLIHISPGGRVVNGVDSDDGEDYRHRTALDDKIESDYVKALIDKNNSKMVQINEHEVLANFNEKYT